MKRVYTYLSENVIHMPVAATYRLHEFQAALNHNKEARFGKILLKP